MIPVKPSDARWNDEQWRAIHERGHHLLISAGAGSGKTAVLVERIIQKIVHQQMSIDALLVLTFTNAAAAEMKHRVRERLEKELGGAHHHNVSTQLNKISNANISTFHGFCYKLLQRYYYLVDLDPGFKIADDIELSIIEDRVIDELFTQFIEAENEDYLRLEAVINSDRDDIKLKELLIKVYHVARANPRMMKWLHTLDELYVWDQQDLRTWPHYQSLVEDVKQMLEEARTLFLKADDYATQSEGTGVTHGYHELLNQDLEWVNQIESALEISYEAVKLLTDQLNFTTFPSPRGKSKDQFHAEYNEEAKKHRDKAKKQLEAIKLYYLFHNRTHLAHFEQSVELIKSLEVLLLSFHDAFSAAKRQRDLLDFSDLEWYTMRLLLHEGERTEIATEIGASLQEIMVDEYQDTNEMQEFIIQAISTAKNPPVEMFMVGDVKQSIYRFRLAEPTIFQKKYKSFQQLDVLGEKIDLMRNYRSHECVLETTNFVFKQIMDERIGEIAYDEAAFLKVGVSQEPEGDDSVTELHLLDRESFDENEWSVVELEAVHLAKLIKGYVTNRYQIYDRSLENHRDVTYKDIVILMRSLTHVTVFQDVFRRYEIPLFAEVTTDLFEAIEIVNVLSALRVIDNPNQDIPLIGLLRSPLFFFDELELAMIRQSKKATYFMTLLEDYGDTGENLVLREKVAQFLATLSHWRELSNTVALSRLIRVIYEETLYYDFVVGLPHGELRKANLDLFYEKARQDESQSAQKVYGFIRYIDKMQSLGKHFPKAKTVTAQDDVVRIMTIHKSKGLEFPIVVLAQIHRQFNKQDESGDVLLHKDYGLAMKYINPTLRLKQQTVAQRVVAKKIHQQMIAEEMRLLYVAMTRAKTKLIFSGVYKVDKKLEHFANSVTDSAWLLPDDIRRQAMAYGDWLLPAFLRHRDIGKEAPLTTTPYILSDKSRCRLLILSADDELEDEAVESQLSEVTTEVQHVDFTNHYPYRDLTRVKAKQSVSERKVDESTPLLPTITPPSQAVIYDRPSFMKETTLTRAEVGTAYHNFMQHFNYFEESTLSSLERHLDHLIAKNILPQAVASQLNLKQILAFTKTPLYQEIRRASVIKTEVPFMMLVPDLKEEHADVLLQGVIDLLLEYDEKVVIVDYKSDYVRDFKAQQDELKARYRVQMHYYIEAISRMYPTKKVECVLYYLMVNEAIYQVE